jgi:integrase
MAYVPKHHRRRFGWIRKLPSGRWQARYKGNDSVLRPAPHTFRTKGMAEQWLAGVEADLMRGSWTVPNPSSESVAVWAERWMASKLNLKPNTKADYDMRLRAYVLPRWGDTPISKITRGDIQAWIQELVANGAQPSTARHAVGTLSRILNEAVIAGALVANPCQRISTPRLATGDIKPLTIEQVKTLAYEIENPPVKPAGNGAAPPGRHHFPEYGLLVRLAAFSGLRAAEIAGLKVNAVDLDNGALRVTETLSEVRGKLYTVPPKTYQARAVPLPDFLVEELRKHIAQLGGAGDGYVFRASEGGALRWQNFYNKHFKPAVLRAGLPKETRFHDLRHTAAAFMIAANAHPRAIMERLGHSSVTVTLGTYGHLLPSLDEELTRKLNAQWTS